MIIEKGKIGVVTSNDGEQKGPQIDILPPGTYRVNRDLFKVEVEDATGVPANKVGLITARDGEPLPDAEYVAKPVTGHDDFQDASKFLASGGQRGPQFDVLRPGTCCVNTMFFKVELDDVAIVERGQVAVVVSNVGEAPPQVKKMGEATAKAYELQNRAVGQAGVTAIEIAKQIATGNIKVVPDFLMQGGDNVGGLLSAFLTRTIAQNQARDPAAAAPMPAAGARPSPASTQPAPHQP